MTRLLGFLTVLILGGCGTKAHFSHVSLPDDTPSTWSGGEHNRTLPISTELLAWVDDANLTRLVDEALRNNPDLQTTALRLSAAKSLNRAEISKQLPSIGARFASDRDNSFLDPLSGERRTLSTQRATLSISWELDLWGRLADERAASNHQLRMQALDYLFARDSLAARIIQAWIELGGIEHSIAIEKERQNTFLKIERVLIERYRNGIGNLDELSSARARSQVTKAELQEQSDLQKRTIRKLEVLLGRYPRTAATTPKKLPVIVVGAMNIPARTLRNRPDVRAAMHNVAAARHLSDAAEKARLPQLTLSSDLFRTATTLGALGGERNYWNVLGSVFAPLYEGGRLQRESEGAAYEADAALMQLHATVLKALKESEDLIGAEQTYSKQIGALMQAVKEAKRSSNFYEQRYRSGLGTLQTVLIAKEEEMTLKRRLNDLNTLRLSNRIDLSLALGMGISHPDRQWKENK